MDHDFEVSDSDEEFGKEGKILLGELKDRSKKRFAGDKVRLGNCYLHIAGYLPNLFSSFYVMYLLFIMVPT